MEYLRHEFKSDNWWIGVCPAAIEQQYIERKSSSSIWHINRLSSARKQDLVRWIQEDQRYVMSRLILAARICEVTNRVPDTTRMFFAEWKRQATEREIATRNR